MRARRTLRVALDSMITLGLGASVAFAQEQPPIVTGPAVPLAAVSFPPSSVARGDDGLMVGLLAIVLGVLLALGAQGIAIKRKRDAEAVRLEAGISEALRRDRALDCFPIIPIARIPLWRGSPAIIEMYGGVPAPELREAALQVAAQEASRIRSDFRIHDRMAIIESPEVRAA